MVDPNSRDEDGGKLSMKRGAKGAGHRDPAETKGDLACIIAGGVVGRKKG